MTKTELAKRISDQVEQNRERLIELCERLINVESVTGNEYDVQQEVIRIMSEIGMDIDAWEPDDDEMRACPYFAETGESFQHRPVVAGVLKGRAPSRGKSLLVNGHVDVVTPEPLEKWSHDPFRTHIEDGKLYGRGASDMKSGVAVSLFCAELLKKQFGGTLADVTIVSVPGEENGGNGTVAQVLRGYCHADGALFPEPTSNMIQPAHRGAAFWRIHLEGKASHGGTKYKGVSAVEKGIKVVQALGQLEKERNETICSKNVYYKDYPLSAPVTVGIFQGGQFTSGVPETCMIEGCIEYVPGEHSTEVAASFEKAVREACAGDAWMLAHPPRVEWFGLMYDPAETDLSDPVVQTAEASFRQMTGREPVINGFEAGTDMRILKNNFGIPGFIFGAGALAMAHAPNEYVEIDKLMENAKVTAMFMANWCGIEED